MTKPTVRKRRTKLDIQIEQTPPPIPAPRDSTRPKIKWPFADLAVGQAFTVNRSKTTMERAKYRFYKTPLGQGRRFLVRKIEGNRTRIWRVS